MITIMTSYPGCLRHRGAFHWRSEELSNFCCSVILFCLYAAAKISNHVFYGYLDSFILILPLSAFKLYVFSLFFIQKLFQNWTSTRRFPGLTFPTYMTTTVQSPVCLVRVNWRFMTSQKLNISVTWTIAVKPLLQRAKFYGQVCEVKEVSFSFEYHSLLSLVFSL